MGHHGMLEYHQDYVSLDFKFLRTFLLSPKQWLVAAILMLWAFGAYTIFQSSYIQYSPDSFLYKALSGQPLTLNFLIRGDRSPTLPILLKLFKSETAFVCFQLAFFYLSWLSLFFMLGKVVRSYPVYLLLISVLAGLSIAQTFFSWHKLILTESISLSGAVLLLALLCRFMITQRISTLSVSLTLVAWVIWQFTRDSNAFFSLLVALGFLVICSLSRISDNENPKWKKGQVMAIVMCLFAAFQLFSINSSDRWKFPLIDVIGLRVLPNEAMTKEFVAMGMPMNDRVLCFKGKNAVDCKKDWAAFGDWLDSGEARDDYQHWLLSHFDTALITLFEHWEPIWTSESILYGHSLESPLSLYATRIALPRGQDFLNFMGISFYAFALAVCVMLHHGFRHWTSVLLMFYAVNIPIAFIAFHGDALDVDRHTINVQLNTYLTSWILILWSLSFTIEGILAALTTGLRTLRARWRP